MGISSEIIDAAELKAIIFGLSRAWEQRIKKLIVETDSKVIKQWLNCTMDENHPYFHNLLECKKLICMPWSCCVEYIPR